MAKAYYLEFSCVPPEVERQTLYALFRPYGQIKRLFTHPSNFTGVIYFDCKEAVEEAYAVLNDAPPYYLHLIPFVDVESPYINNGTLSSGSSSKNIMMNYMSEEDDVMADIGPHLVNVNGLQVSTLTSDDGEIYVPLSEVKAIGFELFDPNDVPKRLNYDKQTVKEFELYLAMKTRKFMEQRNYSLPNYVIDSTVERMKIQAFGSKAANTIFHVNSGYAQNDYTVRKVTDRSFNQPDRRLGRFNENQTLRKPYTDGERDGPSRFTRNNERTQQTPERKFTPHNTAGIRTVQNRGKFDNNRERNAPRSPRLEENNSISRNVEDIPVVTNEPAPPQVQPQKKVEDKATFKKVDPSYDQISLELNSAVGVEVTHVESKNKCWVYRTDQKDFVQDLLMSTNLEADNVTAGQPEIGKICAASFCDVWYRALVLNKFPTLKVLYIDFGNKSTACLKEIRDLSSDLTSVPAQAVCIYFEEESLSEPLDVGLALKIIPTRKLDDGSYVVVQERQEKVTDNKKQHSSIAVQVNVEETAPTPVKPTPKSVDQSNGAIKKTIVINNSSLKENTSDINVQKTRKIRTSAIVSVGSEAQMGCTEFINDTTFVAFIVPDVNVEEISALENIKDEAKADRDFIAKIGDLVAVNSEDGWVRGIIINLKNDKYVAALIDYGTVILSNDICHLNEEYVNIPEFSCVCTCKPDLVDIVKKFKDGIQCTIIETNKLKLKFSNGVTCFVHCDKWDPFVTSPLAAKSDHSSKSTIKVPKIPVITDPPAFKVLKQDDIVIIASVGTEKLFVRTKECNTLFKAISEEILKVEPMPLTSKPVVNQVVLSPYESGKELYRAVVTAVNDTTVEVDFIDYGYQDTVAITNLKTIDKTLASKDSTLIPVKLSGFENKEFSDVALEELGMLSNQRSKFYVETTTNPEVVDLLNPKKNSLSKKLRSLDSGPARNSPESRASSRSSVVTYRKMSEPDIAIGSNELLCINADNISRGKVTFLICDPEISDQFVELSTKLNEFAQTNSTPHFPSVNDICIAVFEGDWYRAKVNIENKARDSYDVYFIDFGNSHTVSSKEIRKIPAEFTTLPPLAVNCVFQDLPKEKISGKLLTRLQELLVVNEQYTVNMIRKEDKVYIISIASIIKTLKQERLL